MFQRLHQNSYPGRLVFSLLCRWGGVGVGFQKHITESLMGWCVPKFGVVVPESPRLDGVVFQKLGFSKKLSQNGVVFQKLGWCCKKLSQNPRWGGVPKVGVVFQKVVPESPRLDGVVFQKVVQESQLCILML